MIHGTVTASLLKDCVCSMSSKMLGDDFHIRTMCAWVWAERLERSRRAQRLQYLSVVSVVGSGGGSYFC
jgi:hypothetical protein